MLHGILKLKEATSHEAAKNMSQRALGMESALDNEYPHTLTSVSN
jgi:hypothetical protein